ncbi:MAG: hypothetical protein V3T31_12925, partial [candidate division Zixibacteria bacterium]
MHTKLTGLMSERIARKAIPLVLFIAILFSFSFANAQVDFTTTISGPGGWGDTVAIGQGPVYIDITATLGTDIETKIAGFGTAFRVYSPDGAVWDYDSFQCSYLPDWTDVADFDLSESTGEFVDDHTDFDDTLFFYGATMFGDGLPPGFSGTIFRVEFAVIDPAQNGKTICIDSAMTRPPGCCGWQWVDMSSTSYLPSW